MEDIATASAACTAAAGHGVRQAVTAAATHAATVVEDVAAASAACTTAAGDGVQPQDRPGLQRHLPRRPELQRLYISISVMRRGKNEAGRSVRDAALCRQGVPTMLPAQGVAATAAALVTGAETAAVAAAVAAVTAAATVSI